MTDTITPEKVMVADHADRILEVLRHRDPTEADAQACSMLMAGLTMLQEARGTAAVLDVLGRIGPALCDNDKGAPTGESISLRDRAGHLIDGLMGRDPDEAHFQARAMLAAGATVLQDRFGSDVALDVLGCLSGGVRARAQGHTSSPASVEDMARITLDGLRAVSPERAGTQARAAIIAGAAFLRETSGAAAALETLSGVSDAVEDKGEIAPEPQPAPAAPQPRTPDELARFVLDGLRGTTPDEAHEQARAVMAGAAAYLVEAKGSAYTSATVDGLVVNATRHIETWGVSPRPDGVSLH